VNFCQESSTNVNLDQESSTQMLYSNSPHDPQAQDVVPVEDLSLEDEIVASCFWRLRDPEPFGDTQARSAILLGYELGHWGPTEAFWALVERGLLGDIDSFMPVYAAGWRALAEEARS
jgi:hypothetical protein